MIGKLTNIVINGAILNCFVNGLTETGCGLSALMSGYYCLKTLAKTPICLNFEPKEFAINSCKAGLHGAAFYFAATNPLSLAPVVISACLLSYSVANLFLPSSDVSSPDCHNRSNVMVMED